MQQSADRRHQLEMCGNGFQHSHSLQFPSIQFPFPPTPIPKFLTYSHSQVHRSIKPLGINSHWSAGNSHSHWCGFPFHPIPIPNSVFYSHSHGIHMGFPVPLGIPFPCTFSTPTQYSHAVLLFYNSLAKFSTTRSIARPLSDSLSFSSYFFLPIPNNFFAGINIIPARKKFWNLFTPLVTRTATWPPLTFSSLEQKWCK